MTRHTRLTLPVDELKRSRLIIYFEDINGDGIREDVKYIIDMSDYNWEPTTEVVYQSKQKHSSNKVSEDIDANAPNPQH